MAHTWVQLGTRFLNLENVTEVRLHDQHRQAHVFFVGGGALQLDRDDALALEALLKEQSTEAQPPPRTIGPSTT